MTMTPPRQHMAIAIDGGGARGLIVAQALIALEKELGSKSLIDLPNLNILTGTSTGTIISAGLALGMRASDIADMYEQTASQVFPPLFPMWLPNNIQLALLALVGLLRPSLYPSNVFKDLLRKQAEQITGNPDFTLGDLGKRLRPDQAFVATVVDINERRTRFLKSYQANDAHWKLWEVVLASTAVPSVLPIVNHGGLLLTDGGIGSYSNPAYIAAREAVEWSCYDPAEVSVFSFGTGWVNAAGYQKALGRADRWHILDWARNMPFMISDDATRAQSMDMIDDYMSTGDPAKNLDYRRFQLTLDEPIDPFAFTKEISVKMRTLGDKLGQSIVNDEHALCGKPGFDPEGLRNTYDRYNQSRALGLKPFTSK